MKKVLFLFVLCTLHLAAEPALKNHNQFALQLYSSLVESKDNVVLSPFGIYSNLALLNFGAANGTAEQMNQVLGIVDEKAFLKDYKKLQKLLMSRGKYALYMANALFAQQGTVLLDPFEKIAQKTFNAKFKELDYQDPSLAIEEINGWIADKTQGKIPHFLAPDEVDSSTRLILANAIYFEGKWVSPFDPKATKSASFFPENGSPIQVEMLEQTGTFGYFENDAVQCLSLPFARDRKDQAPLECIIVLPKRSFTDFQNALTVEKLYEWMDTHSTLVKAQIPKFTLSKKVNLNELLQQLGMVNAFNFDADFSNINGAKDLFLTHVLHETYFSFHEEGVTAAAATTSHLGLKCAILPKENILTFTADHPFLFLVMDPESKTILFMGHFLSEPRP